MTKLAGISGAKAIKCFIRFGYYIARQKGSHVRLKHADGRRQPLTIPAHKELKIGLLEQTIKDAEITIEEFLEKL